MLVWARSRTKVCLPRRQQLSAADARAPRKNNLFPIAGTDDERQTHFRQRELLAEFIVRPVPSVTERDRRENGNGTAILVFRQWLASVIPPASCVPWHFRYGAKFSGGPRGLTPLRESAPPSISRCGAGLGSRPTTTSSVSVATLRRAQTKSPATKRGSGEFSICLDVS